jgi:hypothetical protein
MRTEKSVEYVERSVNTFDETKSDFYHGLIGGPQSRSPSEEESVAVPPECGYPVSPLDIAMEPPMTLNTIIRFL